jgi:hypothetical protein
MNLARVPAFPFADRLQIGTYNGIAVPFMLVSEGRGADVFPALM